MVREQVEVRKRRRRPDARGCEEEEISEVLLRILTGFGKYFREIARVEKELHRPDKVIQEAELENLELVEGNGLNFQIPPPPLLLPHKRRSRYAPSDPSSSTLQLRRPYSLALNGSF